MSQFISTATIALITLAYGAATVAMFAAVFGGAF